MGIDAVFSTLKEIFPQVDFRALRAVAIENPNDLDAAVNDVLNEVLPTLNNRPGSSAEVQSPTGQPTEVKPEEQSKEWIHQQVVKEVRDQPLLKRSIHPQIARMKLRESSAMRGSLQNFPAAGSTDDGNANNIVNQVETEVKAQPLPAEGLTLCESSTMQGYTNSLQNFPAAGSTDVENASNIDHTEFSRAAILMNRNRLRMKLRASSAMRGSLQNFPAVGSTDDGNAKNIVNQVETEVKAQPLPAEGLTLCESSTMQGYTNSLQNFPAAGSTDVENASNIDHTEFSRAAFHEVSTLVDDTNLSQKVLGSSDVDQATGLEEQEYVNTGSEELETVNVDVGLQQSSSGLSTSSVHEKEGVHGSSINVPYEWKDFSFSQTDSVFEGESSIVQLDPPSPEHVPDTVLSKEDDSFCDLADDIKESTTNGICNIDVLEESIEDAKHNKKTLFSAMESVIAMMREVELEEKAVDHAKEEAARGGLDIMVKVEELKQMLAHAKSANDMHAGEVYGEKAILATEVRELQCRLLGLSDERDKSLAILDEMRETLEARLAGVAESRKLAEDEKLEKEESARKALAEQEAIMDKVVEESKALQQAAEENSNLREFLMDRGHIVDMLQGEISVICQDVKLLKEKFDERVPLSQSVSSSQTSCILASSGSSLKSVASGLLLERVVSVGSSESPKALESSKASSVASVEDLSPKYKLGNETVKVDKQALMDDGWDVFDEDILEH